MTKAMQVDPGNVVAARLMDAGWTSGQNQAIKKYKLVRALSHGR